jgi:hypothetical protein
VVNYGSIWQDRQHLIRKIELTRLRELENQEDLSWVFSEPGMVAYTCNARYTGGRARWMMV